MTDTIGQSDDFLTPVGRETLQDRVYDQLRRTLINGGFAAGDMLRIVDMADRLKTRTMPVREALGRLVSEQALEALPNRSVRVPLITRERLDDLERARILIEGRLVALACDRLTAEDIESLKQINRDCEAAFERHGQDVGPITSEINHRFHFHIYRAASSRVGAPVSIASHRFAPSLRSSVRRKRRPPSPRSSSTRALSASNSAKGPSS